MELIPRCQRENSNKYLSWLQKELIPRCQRKNFTLTEFEIQVWVLNFRRGVQYSKIWINGLPFARLTFILSQKGGKKTDVCYDFKNPPSHPWINSLLCLENNSLLCCFNSFYPRSQFPRISDYPGGRGRFQFSKFKFEFEIWVWNLSLKFKLGTVFQPTRSIFFKSNTCT